MGVQKLNLTATVGQLFTLRDPFWIASCHLTSHEGAIKAWQKFEPAALTLKTCTREPETENKKTIHYRLEDSLNRFGKSTYCDGPKQKELLSYPAAISLLKFAKERLTNTKVGLSVLAGEDEDYKELGAQGRKAEADFCELNLKYSFRISQSEATKEWLSAVQEKFKRIEKQIEAFCGAFKGLPVLIKLSREMTWLPGTTEADKLLNHLKKHGKAGIIIANSLRADVPQFVADGEEKNLVKGVICGEHLYDGTIALIDQMRKQCDDRNIPIVASGGMVSEDQILNALRRGAKAVQLCTAFDYFETQYYRTLRSSLHARIQAQGLSKLTEYMERLPTMGIASIQNIPFLYFEKFHSDEAQQAILADVRSSVRMIISILSGFSLFNNNDWRAALRARFEDNLGMRLYLPQADSEAYRMIQISWGIPEGPQMEARKDHIVKAVESIESLWNETATKRADSAKKNPDAHGKVSEAKLEIIQHAQCPFDSVYLFDGKVYIAPYPLVWQQEFASPVYAFFGRTAEYERRIEDLERVRTKAKHTGGIKEL